MQKETTSVQDIHQIFVIDHVFGITKIQHMITLRHWLNYKHV